MTNGCRVWDRENKIWLNLFKLVFSVDGKIMAIETIEAECYGLHQVIIEPSTGQPDKNGVELFAGDRVKVTLDGEETIHIIKYKIEFDYPAYDLEPSLDVDANGIGWAVCEGSIEKIGTIHDADGEVKG